MSISKVSYWPRVFRFWYCPHHFLLEGQRFPRTMPKIFDLQHPLRSKHIHQTFFFSAVMLSPKQLPRPAIMTSQWHFTVTSSLGADCVNSAKQTVVKCVSFCLGGCLHMFVALSTCDPTHFKAMCKQGQLKQSQLNVSITCSNWRIPSPSWIDQAALSKHCFNDPGSFYAPLTWSEKKHKAYMWQNVF